MARCPAHHDRGPSLSITERDGKVLVHCFGGCTVEAICAAIGIGLHQLFTGPRERQAPIPPSVRKAQTQLHGLRSRLTPRDRDLPITLVYADPANPDPALARALALAVEGELAQVVFEEPLK
jgi:hypothetical protein